MGNFFLRAYLQFRNPKVFLIVLALFIALSITCHFLLSYDADWGTTNMVLSIEASIAGAVLMMVAERSSQVQDGMAKIQKEQLDALMQMAQAERQLLTDHIEMLRQLRDNDLHFLELLKKS